MCHTPHYAHLDLEAERESSFGPLGGTKKGPWTVSWYGFSRHLLSLSPRILAEREREGDRGGGGEKGVIREQLCRSRKKREKER